MIWRPFRPRNTRMQFRRITKKKKKPFIRQSRLQSKSPLHCSRCTPPSCDCTVFTLSLMYSKLYLMAKAFIVLNNLVSHIYIYMHLYNVYIYKCSHCYCNSFNKSFSLKTKHCVQELWERRRPFQAERQVALMSFWPALFAKRLFYNFVIKTSRVISSLFLDVLIWIGFAFITPQCRKLTLIILPFVNYLNGKCH